MKRPLSLAVFLLAGAVIASAIPADITYSEGDTTLKLKSGKQQDAQIGDVMNTGDTLKTGKDGQAELNQKGVTIKISHGTVFTLMEKSQAGKTATVMSVALGSIKFKYDKMSGSEPQVRTNGAVAGVRGTEFTVFSGADGSSLFTVDSGLVTVESEGRSVDLGSKEGVEVPLGRPPGDKFAVPERPMDYSTWNAEKLDAMLADPLAAMTSIEKTLNAYIANVNEYNATLKEYRARQAEAVQKREQLLKDKGAAETSLFDQNVLIPLSAQTATIYLNVRFSSLAALSMRRFVAGRLYFYMKASAMAHPDDPRWLEFKGRYDAMLSAFEESIVPQLAAADI